MNILLHVILFGMFFFMSAKSHYLMARQADSNPVFLYESVWKTIHEGTLSDSQIHFMQNDVFEILFLTSDTVISKEDKIKLVVKMGVKQLFLYRDVRYLVFNDLLEGKTINVKQHIFVLLPLFLRSGNDYLFSFIENELKSGFEQRLTEIAPCYRKSYLKALSMLAEKKDSLYKYDTIFLSAFSSYMITWQCSEKRR